MAVSIFTRKWLAAVDARQFAKAEGFKIDSENPDYAHKGHMKLVLRCRDTTWFYWQHLVEQPPRKKKVSVPT